jgi:hydroxyethylthiazole kinase-like uncharacterized protein yjeF
MHPRDNQVLSVAQMRAAEAALVEGGTPETELMRRAGPGAAEWIWRIACGRSVTVLCGPGNNGGDGYVIAEALRLRGLKVTLLALDPPRSPAAIAARAAWRGDVSANDRARGGVFVDCLFGSGLSRPLTGEAQEILRRFAATHDVAVAVDLPSGVEADEGALLGEVPPFDVTLVPGAWKRAHFLMPAMGRMGQLRLLPIGVAGVSGAGELIARPELGRPAQDAHKYSRGLLGVVGGAMPGAAMLAAQAAMHGGAGYVKLLAADTLPNAPAALVIDRRGLRDALDDRRFTALLVGPGLGRDDAARDRLSAALERALPTVIDADALHLLDDDLLEGVDAGRLLVTPHEGELAALCDSFGVKAEGKVARAQSLAGVTGLTVLAKGPDNVLASPDGRLGFFPPTSSWLSTAGTGDVLAGIAASRLATRSAPWNAASEAVWLHGAAARIAGPAFTADDLVRAIPSAYASFA